MPTSPCCRVTTRGRSLLSTTTRLSVRSSVSCLALLAIALVGSSAGQELDASELLRRGLERRAQHVRAALQPDRPALVQLERLHDRRAPASLDVLVVGCDFSDSLMVGRDRTQFAGWPPARRTAQPIPGTDIPIFAAHDAAFFDLQMQRVDDYFRTVSFGRFRLNWDVHPTIVNLPRPMGYYGDADSAGVRAVRMAHEVVQAIDDEVDFSAYDTVVLIHAGAGRETDVNGDSPAQIFSNYLDRRDFADAVEAGLLAEPHLPTQEIPIEHVLVLPEAQSQDPPEGNPRGGFFDVRGVYAFEIGLRLGMLSLADFTPSSFPDSQGIGNFGLMGYGLFVGLGIVPSAPCAMNRWLMGWVEAVDVTESADLRIGAMDEVGAAITDTLLVRVPINDREYWLAEYRLQDPDGDLFYGFDDLNANNFPDYFDADSAFENGWPTSTFDPATDTWERELGAEWDWFMSENPARTADRCQRAGGSGLYIWHVDERVIEDALRAGTNTINGDPGRKGVDVEEADGIQDLDRPTASPFLLGSDDDTWRGEGQSEFGPQSLPSTTTNDGVPTGIRFTDIARVVADSLDRDENGRCTGFVFRPALTLRVEFPVSGVDGPREVARRRVIGAAPLGDLRVLDLGTAAGDPTADGRAEIVATMTDGTVHAWTGALEEWSDGDLDPQSIGPLSVLFAPEGWNGPAAAADVDGDGAPELLVATVDAVFAIGADGQTRLGEEGSPLGALVRAHSGERFVGPVLGSDDGARLAVAGVTDGRTQIVEVEPGSPIPVRRGPVLDGEPIAPIAALDRVLGGWCVAHDAAGGAAVSVLGPDDAAWQQIALTAGSSANPPLVLGLEGALGYAWSDSLGRLHAYSAPISVVRTASNVARPIGALSAGPSNARADQARAIVAVSQGEALYVLDSGLRPLPGFPYRVRRGGSTPSLGARAVAPALVDLDGDGEVEVIWHEPAGAIHAVDLSGRLLDGWPLAGPAEPASTPAVADVDGDGELELVVAGRFERLVAADATNEDFVGETVGEIRVYELGPVPMQAFAPWAQGAGGPGNLQLATVAASAEGEGGLEVSTFELRPNPVRGDFVRVRVEVDSTQPVRASLYTLEGELVRETVAVPTLAGTAFEEDLSLAGIAGGLYVVRVAAGGVSSSRVLSVVR